MRRFSRFVLPGALVAIGGFLLVERPGHGQGKGNGGPDVNIAGPLPLPVTATVTGTASVNVTNTALPVRNVDAQEPVQFETSCQNTDLVCSGVAAYTVPAGKRLVIEYAAIQAADLPAGDAAFMDISTVVGGSAVLFAIPPPPLVLGGRSFTGQVVRLYANPGTNVSLRGRRLSGATGGPTSKYSLSFSGHLEPAP